MKRTPSPRPDWLETCAIEHDSGNVIDFPMIQDLAVAAVGRQSRLHRSQPVVRALRRRRSSRLSSLRSRSGAGRAVRAGARGGAPGARRARRAEDAVLRENQRARRASMSTSPSSAGPTQKDVWTLRQGARDDAGGALSEAPDRPISRRQTPARPRAGRLQPERLGPHAGQRLFRPADASGQRIDAGDVGRDRAWHHAPNSSRSTSS